MDTADSRPTASLGFAPLGTTIYATWAIRMKALLVIKDCWDAVDGSNAEAQAASSAKSMKAKALMLAGVEDIHLAALEELDSARKVWKHLEGVFAASSGPRIFDLRQQLLTIKKQPAEHVVSYMARASSICAQLASAGSKPSTDEHYGAVVSGLPTTGIFAAARLHLRCMPSAQRDIAALQEYLLRFEAEGEQQEQQAAVHAVAAPPRQTRPPKPQQTAGYKGRGQSSSTSSKPTGQRALVPGRHGQVKNVQCHGCHKWGHFKNQCPQSSSSSGGQGAANTLTAIA
jgi:hypothetical protein